jgi:hypothetical protein
MLIDRTLFIEEHRGGKEHWCGIGRLAESVRLPRFYLLSASLLHRFCDGYPCLSVSISGLTDPSAFLSSSYGFDIATAGSILAAMRPGYCGLGHSVVVRNWFGI